MAMLSPKANDKKSSNEPQKPKRPLVCIDTLLCILSLQCHVLTSCVLTTYSTLQHITYHSLHSISSTGKCIIVPRVLYLMTLQLQYILTVAISGLLYTCSSTYHMSSIGSNVRRLLNWSRLVLHKDS